MKIKYRVFVLMLIFISLFSGIYSYLRYVEHRDMLIKGIDEKLYTAAMMARATLPKNYHDRIVDSTSVSRDEFDEIVDRYNKLCVELDMEYFWSLMKVNGKIVFTSSTSPDKNVSNQKHAKYFEVHSNPELYHNVFSKQEPQYQINIDKWGRIKVVLIPFLDTHGRPYMFGASMKLTEVDAMLKHHINESILLGLGFLFIGLAFSYILANLLSKPFNNLMIETAEIAAGQLDKQVEEKGFYEQVALARSFNRMSLAIKEKIAALMKSEENLSTTLDSIGDAVIATDYQGNITRMNPIAEKLTGCKIKESQGKPLTEVFHIVNAQTREPSFNPVKQVLESGEIVGLANHTVLIARDSTEYQIADSAAPIRSADGVITGVVLVFRDVTEEYWMREELRQSEKRFRNFFENSLVGLFRAELASGLFIDINETGARMQGRTREEIVGKVRLVEMYRNPEQRERLADIIRRQGEVQGFEADMTFPNGKDAVFSISMWAYPEKNYLEGVIIDVTERKRAEIERELFHKELKQKNKEMEQVVYVSSHDLRTPLVSVGGYSGEIGESLKDIISILDNEGVPPEIKESLAPLIKDSQESIEYVSKGISKMESLLIELLQFFRSGRVEIKKEELDMNMLMSGILSDFEFQVKENEVKIEISEFPPCMGDEMQVNKLFSNLISNAFKYCDLERPCIIKISGQKENDQSVYCVEDNGIGIAPEYQGKIFEIFHQLNPKAGGEGLGLSIVHKIVERHNGRIWVESELGKGSKFYVSLPS